jgi:hypothetical protein
MCSREGDVDLMIVRTRFVALPELPGRVASLLLVEPMPTSKYVTRRPGHKHRIVEIYQDRRGTGGGLGGGPGR